MQLWQYLTHAPDPVTFWPLKSAVHTDPDIYTGFIPTKL